MAILPPSRALLLLRHQKIFQPQHRAPSMLCMSARGQSMRDYAEKAERRAKFAVRYLVILCATLMLIAGVLISVN
jgi:hypothetical protein